MDWQKQTIWIYPHSNVGTPFFKEGVWHFPFDAAEFWGMQSSVAAFAGIL